jgi:hypothetical protein
MEIALLMSMTGALGCSVLGVSVLGKSPPSRLAVQWVRVSLGETRSIHDVAMKGYAPYQSGWWHTWVFRENGSAHTPQSCRVRARYAVTSCIRAHESAETRGQNVR